MASIAAIRAIDHRDATKLRKARVRTTEALLQQAGTRTQRSNLSQRTGIPTSELLRWAHQADLMRINGIGSEYADLLGSAGVDTLKVLRRRNAANLMALMTQVNTKRRTVQRLPTIEMVQGWVDAAVALDSTVVS